MPTHVYIINISIIYVFRTVVAYSGHAEPLQAKKWQNHAKINHITHLSVPSNHTNKGLYTIINAHRCYVLDVVAYSVRDAEKKKKKRKKREKMVSVRSASIQTD